MWPHQQEKADLVTFTEEILHGKLYFSYVILSNISSTVFKKNWITLSLKEMY